MVLSDKKLIDDSIAQLKVSVAEISRETIKISKKIKRKEKFLKEKQHEINSTKKKIKILAQDEKDSKVEIEKIFEMLTWFTESIDESIANLKSRIIEYSKQAVSEQSKDLKLLVADLKDIMLPLKEFQKIKNLEQSKNAQKVKDAVELAGQIGDTLKIFAEHIGEAIEDISLGLQNANKEALKNGTTEFRDFIEDFYQVFSTFNEILHKLQLTNAVREYLGLNKIYGEIINIEDELHELHLKTAELEAQKVLNEIQIQGFEQFGILRDIQTLRKRKKFYQDKLNFLNSKTEQLIQGIEIAEERLNEVEQDRLSILTWLQALTDGVIENQNIAQKTYEEMYSTLDDIHTGLSIIQNDIEERSRAAIGEIIDLFETNMISFNKIVSVIQKVDQISEPHKQFALIKAIYTKSAKKIASINEIIKKLGKNVTKANKDAIIESFIEFEGFLAIFKEKFHFIQESVSAITLHTSNQLIQNLESLSDVFIKKKLDYSILLKEQRTNEIIISKVDIYLKGINNDLKLSSQSERKRRKKIEMIKTTNLNVETNDTLQIDVKWEISNKGIVPIQNYLLCDRINSYSNLKESVPEPEPELELKARSKPNSISKFESTAVIEKNSLIWWKIPILEKHEKSHVNYSFVQTDPRTKFSQEISKKKKNIAQLKNYRYKNLISAITLQMVEKDGNGTLILSNPSKKDAIWNIELVFRQSEMISNLHDLQLRYILPGKKFIKNYSYKQAKSLVPVQFKADFPMKFKYSLERSTEKDDYYDCEVEIDNPTKYLMNFEGLSFYSTEDLHNAIYSLAPAKSEEIRPAFDFHSKFSFTTHLDSPSCILTPSINVQLVYEYLQETPANLKHFNETPELEWGKERVKILKSEILKHNINQKEKELSKILEEISAIRANMKGLELTKEKLEENIAKMHQNLEKQLKIEEEQKKAEKERLRETPLKKSIAKKTVLKVAKPKKSTKKKTPAKKILVKPKKSTKKKSTAKKILVKPKKSTKKKTTAKKIAAKPKKSTKKKTTAKKIVVKPKKSTKKKTTAKKIVVKPKKSTRKKTTAKKIVVKPKKSTRKKTTVKKIVVKPKKSTKKKTSAKKNAAKPKKSTKKKISAKKIAAKPKKSTK